MNSDTIALLISKFDELKSILLDTQDKISQLATALEKELLTPKEVCEMLKISRDTYQRYVKKGVLNQVQVDKGKRRYVKRSELEKLIAEGKL